jgi:hypothetical protein
MKLLNAALLVTLFASCASQPTGKRSVASTDAGSCQLRAFPGKELYQVRIKGAPINGFWYSYSDASALLGRLEQKGRCR